MELGYERTQVWEFFSETGGTDMKTTKQPSIKTMEKWVMDGFAKATDGCKVEPDGTCPHGCKSWLIELGYV